MVLTIIQTATIATYYIILLATVTLFEKNYCIIREVLQLLPISLFLPQENDFKRRAPATLFWKTTSGFRLFGSSQHTICLLHRSITLLSNNPTYRTVSFHIIPSFLRSTHNSKPTLSWIKHYHLRIHFNISSPQ